jgi:CMD domain protein
MTHDVIDSAAGLSPSSPIAALRAQRPAFVQYSQGSYDVLIRPGEPGGVSLTVRAAIALRVAVLAGFAPLIAQYRQRLREIGAEPSVIEAAEKGASHDLPGLTVVLHHVDRVTTAPAKAEKKHLDALLKIGFSPRDIVTISQIIAFVSYQVRVAAGLRLMAHEA